MSKPKSSSTLHIYTRVSTMAQADHGTSLQSQLELGIKKAKELGFEHQHWDEGGKSSHHEDIADRPVLFDLYRYIKTGIVKHLWIYDQSRLSRNDQVASVFRYECNKQGVTLYTKDGQFDLSSPQDKFLKQLLDAVAEFDNTTRTERTRLLIFSKNMTTVKRRMRCIYRLVPGEYGHGAKAIERGSKEAITCRANAAKRQGLCRSGSGRWRGTPDGVHVEGAV